VQAALKSAYKTLSDVFIEDSESSRKETGDLRSSMGGAVHKIALLQDGQEKLELILRGADVKVCFCDRSTLPLPTIQSALPDRDRRCA